MTTWSLALSKTCSAKELKFILKVYTILIVNTLLIHHFISVIIN